MIVRRRSEGGSGVEVLELMVVAQTGPQPGVRVSLSAAV